MRTEHEIAMINVEILKEIAKDLKKRIFKGKVLKCSNVVLSECKTHKLSCQRFLEFLGKALKEGMKQNQVGNLGVDIQNKIADIKDTIKEYENYGI